MGKLKKYLVSFSVFMINLVLMGVGFLFIKNYDQAKKQQEQTNNDPDRQTVGELSSDSGATDGDSVVYPLDDPVADSPAESVPADSKVKTDPTPTPPVPDTKASQKKEPNSKTKTS